MDLFFSPVGLKVEPFVPVADIMGSISWERFRNASACAGGGVGGSRIFPGVSV